MKTAGLSTFVVLTAYLCGYGSGVTWGTTAQGLLVGLALLSALLVVGYAADYIGNKG